MYICYPYTRNPELAKDVVTEICSELALYDKETPIAPQIYLGQFIKEESEYDKAMKMCLDMLGRCDRMVVYYHGDVAQVTRGMRMEIEFCAKHGIPIEFCERN